MALQKTGPKAQFIHYRVANLPPVPNVPAMVKAICDVDNTVAGSGFKFGGNPPRLSLRQTADPTHVRWITDILKDIFEKGWQCFGGDLGTYNILLIDHFTNNGLTTFMGCGSCGGAGCESCRTLDQLIQLLDLLDVGYID